jgi:SAM-dependent methyltransferase
MAGWGRILEPGERLYWVQPLSDALEFTPEEAEQVIGLAGVVEFVERANVADGTLCLVAGATVRRRACGVGLVWAPELVADSNRLSAGLKRLGRMPDAVRAGVHVVESPSVADDAWRAGIQRLLTALATDTRTIFGIRVPAGAPDITALLTALSCFPSVRDRLKLQWLDRAEESMPPAPVPIVSGVTCDCSLDVAPHRLMRPYLRDGAYMAIDLDVRVPAFSDRSAALVEIPRVDGRSVTQRHTRGWARVTSSPERDAGRALCSLLDEPIETRMHKLRDALDLPRRRAYLQALETDRRRVERWQEFHVYNWPAPAARIHRFVCYEAAELTRPNSPLRALQDLPPSIAFLSGSAFVSEAEAMAAAAIGNAAAIREHQIAAHEYLAAGGRQELTGDSERLIACLPAVLGSTLEIGCGYGLTARRVASRATRYVGLDLRKEQARALRAAGGFGLVADIHSLPFDDGSFDTVIADNVLEHASAPLGALREVRRVMRSGGRAYILIPLDAETSEFQIRTHLWKADERNIRRAATLTDLNVIDLQVLEYGVLGVYGCFPASCGRTCLVVLESPQRIVGGTASRDLCGVPCVES